MNELARSFVLELLVLLGAGLALTVVLVASKRLLDILPFSRSRRETVKRLSPVIGAGAILAALLYAVRFLLRDSPDAQPVAFAIVIAVFVAAAWAGLRDLLGGIFIKAGRLCAVGDTIRLDGMQGRVERMGFRALHLETSEGDEAIVPYSRVVGASIRRAHAVDADALHVFKVRLPGALSIASAKSLIRDAALRSHWSSIVREPQIVLLPDRMLEVTVFALSPDRGPEIEAQVLRAIGTVEAASPAVSPVREKETGTLRPVGRG